MFVVKCFRFRVLGLGVWDVGLRTRDHDAINKLHKSSTYPTPEVGLVNCIILLVFKGKWGDDMDIILYLNPKPQTLNSKP